MELKDTVVGRTNESGVTLPPLHPRCRCAIMYRETDKAKEQNIKEQHRNLTLQSEQSETRWRALQAEIERLAPQGKSPRLEALYAEQDRGGKKLWETEVNLRKIRLRAAENNIILTTGLSRSLDVEDVREIVERVRNAPERIRVLWNMAEADMKIIDKDFRGVSHYDPTLRGIMFDVYEDRQKIYSSRKPYKTLFHEIDHLLDHFMGKNIYLHSHAYENGLVSKTLTEEAQAAVKTEMARLKAQAVSNGGSAKSIKISDAQRSLSKILQGIDDVSRREISDIFSGATKNKVTGGYKHESKYWRDERTLPTEAFAQCFARRFKTPNRLHTYVTISQNLMSYSRK